MGLHSKLWRLLRQMKVYIPARIEIKDKTILLDLGIWRIFHWQYINSIKSIQNLVFWLISCAFAFYHSFQLFISHFSNDKLSLNIYPFNYATFLLPIHTHTHTHTNVKCLFPPETQTTIKTFRTFKKEK